jgi:hypothetical protein
MGLFSRKEKVLDLSEGYRNRERVARLKRQLRTNGGEPEIPTVAPAPVATPLSNSSNESSGGFFSFLGNLASSSPSVTSSPPSNVSAPYSEMEEGVSNDEKRKKFAKRMMDMTGKLEEISNNIYRLQHRIELVEKKLRIQKDD